MASEGYHKLTVQLSSRKMVIQLQKLAAELGYVQSRGGGAGRGSLSQLLEAIAKGEVKLTKAGEPGQGQE